MMPFYYISKTHSVPGYLQLRFGESSRALSAVSFAFMTVLMSGINMYSMALVMKVVLGLGHQLQHLGFRRSRWPSTWRWADCGRPSSTKCCNSS